MNTLPPRRLLHFASGFTIWAGGLMTLYGVHALGCTFAWPAGLLRGILLALFGAHTAILAWLTLRLWRHWRARHEMQPGIFIRYVAFSTTTAAMCATLFTLAPTLVLSLCV